MGGSEIEIYTWFHLIFIFHNMSQKAITRAMNRNDFLKTCSEVEAIDKGEYLAKSCPFGELRFWKKSGRITVKKQKL